MIGSIGGFDATSFAAGASLTKKASNNNTSSLETATSKQPDAVDTFKNYMKMSPAERMEDAWLKSHGYSKEKLASMSSEDRDAVMKQMKQEIADNLKRQTEEKGKMVNVTA